jgi:hypothetical protein
VALGYLSSHGALAQARVRQSPLTIGVTRGASVTGAPSQSGNRPGAAALPRCHDLIVLPNALALSRTLRDDANTKGRSRRVFLDFVVDGCPLYRLVRARGLDRITGLWLEPTLAPGQFWRQVEMLRGRLPGDAPGGRAAVYGCAECGDLACGALTVDLQTTGESVQWSNWRHEFEDVDRGWTASDLPEFPELSFDRVAYGEALDDALRQAGHSFN